MMRWFDDGYGPGYGPGHGWMGDWGWIPMLAGLLLVLAVVVAVAVLLLRSRRRAAARGPVGPPATRPAPEQLLAERFARGDIDEHEYRDRLAALADASAAHPPQS